MELYSTEGEIWFSYDLTQPDGEERMQQMFRAFFGRAEVMGGPDEEHSILVIQPGPPRRREARS